MLALGLSVPANALNFPVLTQKKFNELQKKCDRSLAKFGFSYFFIGGISRRIMAALLMCAAMKIPDLQIPNPADLIFSKDCNYISCVHEINDKLKDWDIRVECKYDRDGNVNIVRLLCFNDDKEVTEVALYGLYKMGNDVLARNRGNWNFEQADELALISDDED
jgi:hypothetical protein